MGSKTAARELMQEAGVPIVPGATCENLEQAMEQAPKLRLSCDAQGRKPEEAERALRLVESLDDFPEGLGTVAEVDRKRLGRHGVSRERE